MLTSAWKLKGKCKCENCLNLGWIPPFVHQLMEGDTQDPYCKAGKEIVESGDHCLDDKIECDSFEQHFKFKAAFIFDNGMVMVFNEEGKQIPELQGKWVKIKEKIYQHKTESSQIYGESYPIEWRTEYNGIR